MLLEPTHYMLDHPMYQKSKESEKEEKEDEKPESFGEIHCFMDKKDRKKHEKKLKLKFEAEDMCNLQDSQSELSLNKTLEFNKPKHVHESV